MAHSSLLKCSFIHFFDVDLPEHNQGKWMDKHWEELLPFWRNLIFRKRRSKPYCKEHFNWSLSRLHLIYVLLTRPLRLTEYPFTVYIAVLNQQLCNLKQGGKCSQNTLEKEKKTTICIQAAKVMRSVKCEFQSNVMPSAWVRPWVCVRMCSQVYEDSRVCVSVRGACCPPY